MLKGHVWEVTPAISTEDITVLTDEAYNMFETSTQCMYIGMHLRIHSF